MGAQIFQPYNLLQDVTGSAPTHDRSLCSITLGTRGSHISTRCSPYAADLACSIVEGVQLWLMAPPEWSDKFHSLFPADAAELDVSSSSMSAKFENLLHGLGGYIIRAHPSDVVFVPGGWVYTVKFLTDTLSFNNSYLRAWKLPNCLQWVRSVGRIEALRRVNLAAVMDQQLPRPDRFWGIDLKEINLARSMWQTIRHEFEADEAIETARAVARSLRQEDVAKALLEIQSTSTQGSEVEEDS